MQKWFYRFMGEEKGPFTLSQLRSMQLPCEAHVRKSDNERWQSIETLDGIAAPETKLCPFCAEEVAMAAVKCKHCQSDLRETKIPTMGNASEKKVLVAILLLIFFGWLGLHAFYAGNSIQGFVFIFLTAVMVGALFIPPFGAIAAVGWVVIHIGDFFRLATGNYRDVKGLKVSNWT